MLLRMARRSKPARPTCRARKISPMPPLPRRRITSKRPKTRGLAVMSPAATITAPEAERDASLIDRDVDGARGRVRERDDDEGGRPPPGWHGAQRAREQR